MKKRSMAQAKKPNRNGWAGRLSRRGERKKGIFKWVHRGCLNFFRGGEKCTVVTVIWDSWGGSQIQNTLGGVGAHRLGEGNNWVKQYVC